MHGTHAGRTVAEAHGWDAKYDGPAAVDRAVEEVRTILRGTGVPAILRELAPRLAAGARVLEAGSGTGRLGIALASMKASEVHGVDFAARGLALGAATCERIGRRVRFIRADLAALPYAAESFDAIITDSVLEHLDDPDAAISEFARVLRPGGLLALTVPNRIRPDGWDLYVSRFPVPYRNASFTPSAVRRLCARHGFGVRKVFGDILWLPRSFARKRSRPRSTGTPAAASPAPAPPPPGLKRRLREAVESIWPPWAFVMIGVIAVRNPTTRPS